MRLLLGLVFSTSVLLAGCGTPGYEVAARSVPPAITIVGTNYDALVACVWQARSKRLIQHYPQAYGHVFRFYSRGLEGTSNLRVTVFRDGGPPRAELRQYAHQTWSARDQRLASEVRGCAEITESTI